ncbi:MAG: GbsR/MarR family transcriptional regulator [Verrucomicrobiales bacterium]
MPASSSAKSEQYVDDVIAAYLCRMASTVGLPRSTALIYHALFVAEEPQSFTQIQERSGLGKATASTGLKLLTQIGAAEIVEFPEKRGTYYAPELSARRLIAGLFRNNVLPGFEAGGRILSQLGDSEISIPTHLEARISNLKRWHELSEGLLPMLQGFDPN